jgi:hypothetical protein
VNPRSGRAFRDLSGGPEVGKLCRFRKLLSDGGRVGGAPASPLPERLEGHPRVPDPPQKHRQIEAQHGSRCDRP